LNPQIIKSYAAKDLDRFYELIFGSAKYSLFLMMLFVTPLYLNVQGVLHLWLGEYPQEAETFIRISLIAVLFGVVSNPFGVAVEATGKVGMLGRYTSTMSFLIVGVIYLLLRAGCAPWVAYLVNLLKDILYLILKIMFTHYLTRFTYTQFMRATLIPVLKVAAVCACLVALQDYVLSGDSLIVLIARILLMGLTVAVVIVFVGLNRLERDWVKVKIFAKLKFRKY
jgi:O-antigen/teichoic acid export membrane protein